MAGRTANALYQAGPERVIAAANHFSAVAYSSARAFINGRAYHDFRMKNVWRPQRVKNVASVELVGTVLERRKYDVKSIRRRRRRRRRLFQALPKCLLRRAKENRERVTSLETRERWA